MRRYDMRFKIDAIKLAAEIGNTKAAKELCIPQGTLDTWVFNNKRGEYDNVAIVPSKALSLVDEVYTALQSKQ